MNLLHIALILLIASIPFFVIARAIYGIAFVLFGLAGIFAIVYFGVYIDRIYLTR